VVICVPERWCIGRTPRRNVSRMPCGLAYAESAVHPALPDRALRQGTLQWRAQVRLGRALPRFKAVGESSLHCSFFVFIEVAAPPVVEEILHGLTPDLGLGVVLITLERNKRPPLVAIFRCIVRWRWLSMYAGEGFLLLESAYEALVKAASCRHRPNYSFFSGHFDFPASGSSAAYKALTLSP
jgi:hypothetical protein